MKSKETQISQLRQKLSLALAQIDESNEKIRTLLLKIAELEKEKTDYYEMAERLNLQQQQMASELHAGKQQIEKLSALVAQRSQNNSSSWF